MKPTLFLMSYSFIVFPIANLYLFMESILIGGLYLFTILQHPIFRCCGGRLLFVGFNYLEQPIIQSSCCVESSPIGGDYLFTVWQLPNLMFYGVNPYWCILFVYNIPASNPHTSWSQSLLVGFIYLQVSNFQSSCFIKQVLIVGAIYFQHSSLQSSDCMEANPYGVWILYLQCSSIQSSCFMESILMYVN